MIYLDHNATSPMRPEVLSCMQDSLHMPLNPSSVHSIGRKAKKTLEDARKIIAESISVWPNEVIFTSSGTEANNMVLRGVAAKSLLVSAIEHSSVLRRMDEKHAQQKQAVIPVDESGRVNLPALDAMLADHAESLVSVMLANNETGIIQPIAEIRALCKKHGALLHCDAVQALGKIPVDFGTLGVDIMSLSAHKLGGPVGAAALIIRQGLPITPLIKGGGQELGRRAGTENIAAIAGFAKAVECVDYSHMQQLRGWLVELENKIGAAGGLIIGQGITRLPNTVCLSMPGVTSEVQLMDFDLKGVAISAGSACSSGRIEPSHVLLAMQIPKSVASCAIRVSGGWNTKRQDIDSFTKYWEQNYVRLKNKD